MIEEFIEYITPIMYVIIIKFDLKLLKQYLHEKQTQNNQLKREIIFLNDLISEYFSWKVKQYN